MSDSARQLKGAAKAAARTNDLRGAVQNLVYGQPVDAVATFTDKGWRAVASTSFKTQFAPKVLPANGGGTVVHAKLPNNISFLVRSNGSAGTNGLAPIEQGATVFDKLGKAGKVMRPVGIALNAASNYRGQLAQDSETELERAERHKRATYRCATVTTTEVAAGAAGASLGAAAGTFLIPIPGVGSVVGGLIGGYFAAKKAGEATNAVVDRTIDSVGEGDGDGLRDDLADLVDDIGYAVSRTWRQIWY